MAWLKGCDFSWQKPNLQQLWDAGYRVILVYMSTTSGKGVTQSYVNQALDIGFKILPLYETSATAALGGYSTGVSHAQTATSIARSLGCPPEVPIIYALDSDFSSAQLAGPISDYINGLHHVNGPDAVYGGYNQLNYLIRHGSPVTQNFQTYAWSGGKWLPTSEAPIEQYHNGVKVAGGVVDDCRVQDNIIFWEKNMALTKADIDAIWNDDIIPSATDPKGSNPTWAAKNAITDIDKLCRNLVSAFGGLKSDQNALSAKVDALAAAVAALPTASVNLTTDEVEAAVLAAVAKLKVVQSG